MESMGQTASGRALLDRHEERVDRALAERVEAAQRGLPDGLESGAHDRAPQGADAGDVPRGPGLGGDEPARGVQGAMGVPAEDGSSAETPRLPGDDEMEDIFAEAERHDHEAGLLCYGCDACLKDDEEELCAVCYTNMVLKKSECVKTGSREASAS